MENRMHDFDNFAKQAGEREQNERNGKKYMRNIWKDGIFGVVVGDALGCPVQFETREEVAEHPIRGMRGHGTFNLPAGSWTDDSSLTLALLESIVRTGFLTSGILWATL